MTDFAEFVEAFSAGYIAHRDGLVPEESEAFLTGIHEAYRNSGGQRTQREIAAMKAREDEARCTCSRPPAGLVGYMRNPNCPVHNRAHSERADATRKRD